MLGTKYDCIVEKYSKDRTYKGCCIFQAQANSSGVKYFAYVRGGTVRADTLKGIKQLITKYL